MFLGHFGAGFCAKRVAPLVSLGTLFLAAQFNDLLWSGFLLLKLEEAGIKTRPVTGPPLEFVHYPVSHSLLATCGWALLIGGIYYWRRHRLDGAFVLGLLVLSHWLLDILVHYADLPLYPGGPKVGLALWSKPLVALVLELLIFVAGLVIYLRCTRAGDKFGTWGLWGLALLLVAIQMANYMGPPPPSIAAVALAGQAQWLLVAWGYWLDRHRCYRQP